MVLMVLKNTKVLNELDVIFNYLQGGKYFSSTKLYNKFDYLAKSPNALGKKLAEDVRFDSFFYRTGKVYILNPEYDTYLLSYDMYDVPLYGVLPFDLQGVKHVRCN